MGAPRLSQWRTASDSCKVFLQRSLFMLVLLLMLSLLFFVLCGCGRRYYCCWWWCFLLLCWLLVASGGGSQVSRGPISIPHESSSGNGGRSLTVCEILDYLFLETSPLWQTYPPSSRIASCRTTRTPYPSLHCHVPDVAAHYHRQRNQ